MSAADKLVFRGIDLKEVEDFIEAVRQLAFAQGKQRNNEWIIDLVDRSLAGDALRWHAALPQETQCNWYLLQRALVTQFPVIFRGIDGIRCDLFVQYVRRKAIEYGKSKDPIWMADYASEVIAGDALRWYNTLDKETKGNWDLLQTALFQKYPTSDVRRPLPDDITEQGTSPTANSLCLLTQFPVVFRGIDGVECDSFVRHVRCKAAEHGKLKDQIWMADYAAVAMADDGLRWYDTLDEETKGNWDLLQRALLRQYPAPDVRRPVSDYEEKRRGSLMLRAVTGF
ncbi:hypothetical protein FRB99_007625 [Tulasnella sp. 403]|nr:hypothetical protein FRB99_007625 [Tulasnella sp. 403]